jgi:hypothetical protein
LKKLSINKNQQPISRLNFKKMCNPLPNPSNKSIAAVALVLDLFWPGVGMMIVGFADDSRSNPGN